MNKQCYRLVFSRVRGMLVAVAEIVASEGKSPGESRTAKRRESRAKLGSQLTSMAYGMTAVIGGAMLAPMEGYSQTIVADPNAPANQRPTIGTTQNGVPLVNIQAPSKAGVSRNTYSQFDVQAPGVILNNSTRNVQQTELGGMIRGNAQLKGRNARVILNEVNSQDPSQLRGAIEVAGQRAQVIIANPSGVSCDGCGFINVTRGTLTTGTPIVNEGVLQGYAVRGGTVRIDGAGLDASRTDYAEIIGRAVEVNASIFANELSVTAGANQVATDGSVTPIAGQGAAPMVAIDVSQLGGMYAGKITLVGTEAGVGVRNAGNLGASAGEVVLTLEGRLVNAGNITATGEIRADARSGIENEGMLYAQSNTQLLTLGDIDNRGVIASGGNTTIAANGVASRILNRAGALAAAGLATNGEVGSAGQLALRAGGDIRSAGDTLAGGEQRLTAREIDLRGARVSGQALTVNATGALRADEAQLSGNRVELTAQSLSNVRGQIAQLGEGRLGLAILGAFDNQDGVVVGDGGLALTAGEVNNAGGTVVSGASLELDTGTFDNRAGAVQAQEALRLNTAGLTNADGVVSGGQIDLDAGRQSLDNTRGRIVATNALTIGSGALVNTAGLLQSQGALVIDTRGQALVNAQSGASGGILSQGFLALTTGDLTNTSGYIGANGPVRLQARAIDNRGGTLSSAETLEARGDFLDNRGGTVQANDDVRLALAGALDNTGSMIRAGGTLSAAAERITNANTRGTDRGLQGTNVALDARTIENTAGAIRASEALTARASGHNGVPYAFTNTGGALMAGRALNVEGDSLSSDGQLLSLGDLSIVLERDYVHRGELLADGTVRIELRGRLLNLASLQGGEGLVVKAANIENTASGELSSGGKTQLTASDTLNNRGLIDGRETVARANTLTNLGRIYGDTLGIDAGALSNVGSNGAAPVIAARDNLQLGAKTIDNREHGLIFSAGDLAIGGALDANGNVTGQAERLNNASATIEALGSGRIAARLIDNSNEHFSTKSVVVDQERVLEFQVDGQEQRYSAVDGAYVFRSSQGGYRLHTPEANVKRYKEYDYTRTTTETQVATSDPGQILTGGNLTFTADAVNNDKSQIVAGGAITVEGGKLTNTDALGERRVSEAGTVSAVKGKKRTTQKRTEAYRTPDQVETITLEATVYRENTAPQGTGTQIAARTTIQVGEKAVTEIAALDRTDTVVRSLSVTPTLPNNQLYKVNPQGDVLIQTDARFGAASPVNPSEILKNLAIDPSKTQTRLGDAFYEQRLIREQVVSLTGERFLQGFASDEQQYAGLLTRGAAFAQAQGVRLGEGLTTEQMAKLTDDVVLLVEQKVTLPDGTTSQALVPKVYARASTEAVRPSQAILSGDDVRLKLSGDLFNTGGLTARNVVEVSANSIDNVVGRIQANAVLLESQNDINHVNGGRIRAQEYLQAAAGRDLNIASTTQSEANTSKQFGTTTATTLTRVDKVGSLEVTGETGTLIASAGRDANFTAAAVVNRGNGGTLVSAGNDVNFKTLAESSSRELSRKNYYRRDAETREVGTQIQSIGDLIVQAGRDVNARAAELTSSEGALQVQADRDVNLEAGEATSDYYQKTVTKKKKTLSTKVTTRIDSLETTTAQGSNLSGVTTEVIAGQDIQLTGSSVVSDQATRLQAGRDITAEAAIETRKEGHYKHVKKSGVFSGGTFAVTAGQKKLTQDQKAVSTAVAAATVGSTLGDVIIRAGQEYAQVGSDLLTPAGSVDVEAQKLLVKEARATSRTVTETKQQQAGLTLGLTGGVVAAIETAQQLREASKETKSGRLKTLATATSALQAKNLYDSAQIATQSGGQAPGVSLSLSIGASVSSSKSTETSNNAIGSQVVAAGNGRFVVTGGGATSDLTIQGSTVQLGNAGEIASEGALNLLAAQNTAALKSTNKSGGGSVGIGIGSQTGISVSASIGRGKANGKDETYTNTLIQAGKGLTLQSGGDVTLKGAVISAEQVSGTIGGILTIESVQDKSTFESKQMSAGVSFTIGAGAASASFSQSKIDSDYVSVREQSGIRAGDGGFQLNVLGNTELNGGAITSTQVAVDQGKNFLSTATLKTSDIKNRAEYDASSVGLSGGFSRGGKDDNRGGKDDKRDGDSAAATSDGATGMTTAPQSSSARGFSANAPTALAAGDNSTSTTRSAVSGAQIVIRDEAGQLRLTGVSIDGAVAKLDGEAVTGKDTANALKPIFDQREIEANFAIVGAFTREVGTFRANQAAKADLKKSKAQENERRADDINLDLNDMERARLREEAMVLRKEATAINENWGLGGTYSTITTALTGALSGNVGGSGTQIIQSAAANYLQSLGAREIKKIADSLSEDTTPGAESARAALQGIVGCASASAQGASCASGALGASAAVVFNNLIDQASGKAGATLSASEKQAREDLVASLVTGFAVATGVDGSEIAVASTAATIETENNSLLRAAKIVLKTTKQALKSYQKHGKVSVSDLKKVFKDEGLSIADNLLTLADGDLSVDDALAIIDLVVGSEFNKAGRGKSLEKIAEIEKKYFSGKTSSGVEGAPPPKIHSRYSDGTPVAEGQQPGKVTGPISDSPHSVVKYDSTNGRIYKAREYAENGVPVRDIDFTHPTYPNGKLRPDHVAPEQHRYTPNNPNNPKAGYKRGKGEPLEKP